MVLHVQKAVREVNRRIIDRLMSRVDYCEWCGKMRISLTPHPILPKSQGGSNVEENLIVLCLQCHDAAQPYRIDPKELSKRATQRHTGLSVLGPVKG